MVAGLREFLKDYPDMSICPMTDSNLVVEGDFRFSGQTEGGPEIVDGYALRIEVPEEFPAEVPRVFETGGKIPRTGDYHVNPNGSLCLGSPLRLLWKLSKNPTLTGFAGDLLVPYLYGISHKLKFGGDLPLGELAHGSPGELADYANLFGLKTPEQAARAVEMLGMKKRRANKLPCPCGCRKRLGKCRFNFRLKEFRDLASRTWFRSLRK